MYNFLYCNLFTYFYNFFIDNIVFLNFLLFLKFYFFFFFISHFYLIELFNYYFLNLSYFQFIHFFFKLVYYIFILLVSFLYLIYNCKTNYLVSFCTTIIIFILTGGVWSLFEYTWSFWWSGDDFDEFFLILMFLFFIAFFHTMGMFNNFVLKKYIFILTYVMYINICHLNFLFRHNIFFFYYFFIFIVFVLFLNFFNFVFNYFKNYYCLKYKLKKKIYFYYIIFIYLNLYIFFSLFIFFFKNLYIFYFLNDLFCIVFLCFIHSIKFLFWKISFLFFWINFLFYFYNNFVISCLLFYHFIFIIYLWNEWFLVFINFYYKTAMYIYTQLLSFIIYSNSLNINYYFLFFNSFLDLFAKSVKLYDIVFPMFIFIDEVSLLIMFSFILVHLSLFVNKLNANLICF